MKKSIQILMILAVVSVFTHRSTASPATTAASRPTSLVTANPKTDVIASGHVIASAAKQSPIFGIGKPKYNKRRIDRQNMPGPVFRRGRRLQRKNGLGFVPSLRGGGTTTKQSPHPETQFYQTGILTLNPLLA